jgi:2-polyprenyl-3-methyl-5-hydroxy-6-metoxy-1,4-benzoquinol methylase
MKSLLKKLYQNAGLAYYFLFLGPRGIGRPVSTATWDAQYRSGHWSNFDSTDEMPRYAIIAAYIRRHGNTPAVLDVGCGNGRLLQDLDRGSLGHFVGLDVSAEAIEQARIYDAPGIEFAVADFADWQTTDKFDFIVFNDALYYAKDPAAVLQRYAAMVTPDGVIINVMFRHRNTMVIWKKLERAFVTLDRIEVTDRKGELTDIRLLRAATR